MSFATQSDVLLKVWILPVTKAEVTIDASRGVSTQPEQVRFGVFEPGKDLLAFRLRGWGISSKM